MRRSRMAGPRGRAAAGGRSAELLLDRPEHRLAVGVAALVVAHLAELRRAELAQAILHLRGGEVVVAEDRERRADAGGAARAVDLADHTVGGAAERAAEDA